MYKLFYQINVYKNRTLLKVVGFPDVHAHQGHELQLRQPLPGGRRQGQQVPEVCDLCVDQVPPKLARPFGRLGRVEPMYTYGHNSDVNNDTIKFYINKFVLSCRRPFFKFQMRVTAVVRVFALGRR